MKEIYRQWIAAFVMGMLVPGVVLGLCADFSAASAKKEPAAQHQHEQGSKETTPLVIPVLHDGASQNMELEEYLVGVVLAEMPASFEPEALKAQAVAARTCALYCTSRRHKHDAGAVCTDANCCQAYLSAQDYQSIGGSREDLEKVRQAVLATAGQVVVYEGELIDATYFSCSGGRTEDAAAVWGGEVPYLQSVESPGEENAKDFHHQVSFSPEEFLHALGVHLQGTPEQWLGPVVRTRGGGVSTMMIGGRVYSGGELRQLLGLYSTAFVMEISQGEIHITTSGRGHRVGMSQYGADAMALRGSTYQEILTYYYRGAELTNWAP